MYHANVSRENGFWVAVVDGVPGGATETRRLSALDAEVRDLLSGLLDIDEDAVSVEYNLTPALGTAANELEQYRQVRRQLDVARDEYEQVQVRVVHELRAEEVSLRDAAELLDVSFQRVQQLA